MKPPADPWTEEELRIDRFVKSRLEGGRLKVLKPMRATAVLFCRRSLEVAITNSDGAEWDHQPVANWRHHWDDLRDNSGKARKSLELALTSLRLTAQRRQTQRTLADNLVYLRSHRQRGSIESHRRRARKDAIALRTTIRILERAETDAAERLAQFLEMQAPPRDHAKHRFVFPLAEAWVCLFGKKPSTNLEPKNPFLKFVADAWSDWKGESVEAGSFARTAATVSKEMTPADVKKLLAAGPTWR